jgi:hypothetical protein
MIESPRVKWIIEHLGKGKILDIGFVGETQPFLHQKIRNNRPDETVVGVDINQEKVIQLGMPNTLVCDAFKLPFKEGVFHTIVLAEVFEHH